MVVKNNINLKQEDSMSIEQRLPSCFSPIFTPALIEGAEFLSRSERCAYKDLSEKVQRCFLQEKLPVFEETVTLISSCEDTNYYGLTFRNAERLMENIRYSGFDARYEETPPCSLEKRQIKVTVSLPESNLEETGRRSPRWEDSFKGSLVRENFQKLNETTKEEAPIIDNSPSLPSCDRQNQASRDLAVRAYEETVSSIQAIMQSDRKMALLHK